MSDDTLGGFLHNMLGGTPPEPGPPYTHAWRLSIPVPFYSLLHVICGCGKRFWGAAARASRRYREHYERAHITGRAFTITMDPDSPRAMGLSAGPLPIRQEGEP